MALPTPPGAKPTLPPAAAAAPVAAPQPQKPARGPIATFGPGRGPGCIEVPEVGGINLSNLFESLKATIQSNVGDSEAFVNAFEALSKANFPGNKDGRAAYDAARIVGIVHKRSKGPGVRQSGGGKVAKLQSLLEKLMGALGPEALAAAGLSAEDLAAAQ